MAARVVFERSLPPAVITIVDSDSYRAAVWLAGEIDGECVSVLRSELTRLQLSGRRLVRLDVSAVTFFDSATLGVIVHAHQVWLGMRGTLVLLGVSGVVARVLQVTGTDRELLWMPPTPDPARDRDLVGTRS